MYADCKVNKENCIDSYPEYVTKDISDAASVLTTDLHLENEATVKVVISDMAEKKVDREFGTELTNTDASSDTNTDEKSPVAVNASNIPHVSYKPTKMSDHFTDSSSSPLNFKRSFKAGIDLTKLKGKELELAIKEEMKLRKKELNKDISFQDVINFRTPELVGEYAGQCMRWMKQQEEQFKIQTNYMDLPKTKRMSTNKSKTPSYRVHRNDRAIAVDKVMEIHRKYGLVPETLFIAVSTIDRYLGIRKEALRRQKDVEAIGIAALLIASKYEDIYPPALDEMIKMMNRPSTRKEVLEWEFKILKTLVFHITVPTPYRFLQRFSSISMAYQNASQLAQYITELALYDYDIAYNLLPSEIAAVAIFAAVNFDYNSNSISEKQKWSSEISKEASIKKTKLIEYFNTYFVDLAYRAERELKVNDINIKYPQFQYVDEEAIGLFNKVE